MSSSDQNSNENILRISALKFFVPSWGISTGSPKKIQGSYKKLSGQKYLQYFSCYFGPNDETKNSFRK